MKKSGNMRSNSENSEAETVKPKPGRKGANQNKAQEFIIKLFDRTINLSELNGSTPLYKICHDWITSSHNMTLMRSQSKKPVRPERQEERDIEVLEKLKNEEINVVQSMPPFDKTVKMKEPMEIDEEEEDERRKNLDSIMLFNEDLEEFSKDNLLAEHKSQWKKKKEEWIKDREDFNEKKYSESVELLELMYKPF